MVGEQSVVHCYTLQHPTARTPSPVDPSVVQTPAIVDMMPDDTLTDLTQWFYEKNAVRI